MRRNIEWTEGLTKTRQGGLSKKQRRVPQRMFAVGGDRCPVGILEKAISKRPTNLAQTGPLYLGPLYLTPLQKFKGRGVWYSEAPLGVNKIDSFMNTMAALAGLDTTNKKFTNHCVRKTLVRKLQKQGVTNDKIASITGHSSEQSLRDYADTDLSDHSSISKILSLPHRPSLESQSFCTPVSQCNPSSAVSSSHSASVASSSQYDSSYSTQIPQYHSTSFPYYRPPFYAPVPQYYQSPSTSHAQPQYVFNSCNVYFGANTSTCTSTEYHAQSVQTESDLVHLFLMMTLINCIHVCVLILMCPIICWKNIIVL